MNAVNEWSSITSPLTRSKARELLHAQSPSKSVLTEPIYSSPRETLYQNENTARPKRRNATRSTKVLNQTTNSSGSFEKENSPSRNNRVSIIGDSNNSNSKSATRRLSQSVLSTKKEDRTNFRKVQVTEEHTKVSSISTTSSPPILYGSKNTFAKSDSSSELTNRNKNTMCESNRKGSISTYTSSLQPELNLSLNNCRSFVARRWQAMILCAFVCILLWFVSFNTGSRFSSIMDEKTNTNPLAVLSFGGWFAWFDSIFKNKNTDELNFQTAFSFLVTSMNAITSSWELESKNENIILAVRKIVENTDERLKASYSSADFPARRLSLYRQIFHLLGIENVETIPSLDIVAEILASKLPQYKKLISTDYALQSQGAKIFHSVPSKRRQQGRYWLAKMASILDPSTNKSAPHYPKGPETVLSANTSYGNCWAFAGKTGSITVQLSKYIKPIAFSLEHTPSQHTSVDWVAPKMFRFYLLFQEPNSGTNIEWLTGTYQYQMGKDKRQLFPILSKEVPIVNMVRLEILDNYGGSYTCLYHFRVHGREQ